MTESNDEKAAQVRQWFIEAAQHPIWKHLQPREGNGGDKEKTL